MKETPGMDKTWASTMAECSLSSGSMKDKRRVNASTIGTSVRLSPRRTWVRTFLTEGASSCRCSLSHSRPAYDEWSAPESKSTLGTLSREPLRVDATPALCIALCVGVCRAVAANRWWKSAGDRRSSAGSGGIPGSYMSTGGTSVPPVT